MDYKIAPISYGDNPDNWPTIQEWIGEADVRIDPDSGWQSQAEKVESLSGMDVARGYAIATWHWNALSNHQRQVLREICGGSNLSARVYLQTDTNDEDLCTGEPIWKTLEGIAHWVEGEEDKEADETVGIDITFTHLVEVS
jgi:hypothetical protein